MKPERWHDTLPEHMHMARRVVEGWGGYATPSELEAGICSLCREDGEGDGHAMELACRMLHESLGWLELFMEVIDGDVVPGSQ